MRTAQPWLETLNGLLRGWFESGEERRAGVLGVEGEVPGDAGGGMPAGAVTFVWLDGSKELLDGAAGGAASRVYESEAAG